MSKKDKSHAELVSAISGTCGASFGKFFVHPVDTIKAKLQVVQRVDLPKGGSSVIASVAQQTIKMEGLGGLYRGFAVSLFGSIPAAGLYFGSYEFFKKNSLQYEYFQQHPFISYLAGGIFAESIACAIFVPVDVIKERRQVQNIMKNYQYKNDLDALK